jgi:NADH-quinone oxidoreductase subunit N
MMADWLTYLRPEIMALSAALLVILADLVQGGGSRRWLGWLSAALAAVVLIALCSMWGAVTTPVELWGGVIQIDRLGLIFKLVFLAGVAVVAVGSVDFAVERFRYVGEYYGLLFFAAAGMMLMASAGDLLTLYLGLELASLSLYVLAAFAKKDPRSGEAGLKYVVLGATASAIYLYGTSLIYGAVGGTRFALIAHHISGRSGAEIGLMVGGVFVLVAFAFKIAAAPFHMWAPDVYQGAPTPVTGFLSTASKAAGLAALVRVLLGPMLAAASQWVMILVALSALSMVFGNLVALSQRNIKRMLAYSGIAQAGYALMGIAALSPLGLAATSFFIVQYLFANVGAFLVVTLVGSSEQNDEIASYAGLSARNPVCALALLLFLLSLGGIPPLAGFWGKVFLFWAAIREGMYGLVVIGVLTTVLSLYYYLMVARAMYILPAGERQSIRLQVPAVLAVALCAATVIALAYPRPLLDLAWNAAKGFLAAGGAPVALR